VKVDVSKVNVGGAGYLIVDEPTGSALELGTFAKAACDFKGLIGADGLAWISGIGPDSISISAFSRDGHNLSFSINAAIAAAAYSFDRIQSQHVRIEQSGGICYVQMDRHVAGFLRCRAFRFSSERLTNARSPLEGPVTQNVIPGVSTPEMFLIGDRRQIVVETSSVDDTDLADLGRDIKARLAREPSEIAVTMMHRIGPNKSFIRTYDANDDEVVRSCLGAAAAAALFMNSTSSHEQSELVIFGVASSIDVALTLDGARRDVELLVRAAEAYTASAEWTGAAFIGQMTGSINLTVLGTLTELGEAELGSIALDGFYKAGSEETR